ncbi:MULTISPECIES: hypothetical protein [Agrobacterium]|uniref:hypothetical protein n=1 Tax=Agrobacterium TaxID=357 RepID=UPI0009D18E53|nr:MULTISPECIES: hypothetical protein [Agrobacterium]CUX72303.1 hypothetical protein AGR6A_pb0064 [Agrobacterium sp. NCPPB 925]
MDQVIRFPKGRTGERVFCPVLKLYFPTVLRVTAKNYVAYSLISDAKNHPARSSFEPISCLEKNDAISLVVRWHRDIDAADSYLAALRDTGKAFRHDGIHQTDGGCFTLTERETRADWPSPMIFYVAEHSPVMRRGRVGRWEIGVSITGRQYDAGITNAAVIEDA